MSPYDSHARYRDYYAHVHTAMHHPPLALPPRPPRPPRPATRLSKRPYPRHAPSVLARCCCCWAHLSALYVCYTYLSGLGPPSNTPDRRHALAELGAHGSLGLERVNGPSHRTPAAARRRGLVAMPAARIPTRAAGATPDKTPKSAAAARLTHPHLHMTTRAYDANADHAAAPIRRLRTAKRRLQGR